jgi:hypothetical protein
MLIFINKKSLARSELVDLTDQLDVLLRNTCTKQGDVASKMRGREGWLGVAWRQS